MYVKRLWDLYHFNTNRFLDLKRKKVFKAFFEVTMVAKAMLKDHTKIKKLGENLETDSEKAAYEAFTEGAAYKKVLADLEHCVFDAEVLSLILLLSSKFHLPLSCRSKCPG